LSASVHAAATATDNSNINSTGTAVNGDSPNTHTPDDPLTLADAAALPTVAEGDDDDDDDAIPIEVGVTKSTLASRLRRAVTQHYSPHDGSDSRRRTSEENIDTLSPIGMPRPNNLKPNSHLKRTTTGVGHRSLMIPPRLSTIDKELVVGSRTIVGLLILVKVCCG
jgi:hypothetical protein